MDAGNCYHDWRFDYDTVIRSVNGTTTLRYYRCYSCYAQTVEVVR